MQLEIKLLGLLAGILNIFGIKQTTKLWGGSGGVVLFVSYNYVFCFKVKSYLEGLGAKCIQDSKGPKVAHTPPDGTRA